jgi:MYXO-CTERM domain-containing protein
MNRRQMALGTAAAVGLLGAGGAFLLRRRRHDDKQAVSIQ